MRPEPAIRFERFAKRFGRVQAVQPLDLEVQRGETFALLGPNGSGKSTLIRAVAGVHAPSQGRICIGGQPVDVGRRRPGPRIAYMPQRVTLPVQLTARETLVFFAKLRGVNEGAVDSALDFVALSQDADRRVRGFSGGMLQRLGLAVAFLEEVPIYVLDEPTLNLDAVGLDRFREKVSDLKQKGATILFSSHILQDAARLADRVGIMAEGELVSVEPMPEFKNMVARETSVRIVLERTSEQIISAAVTAGAQTSSVNGRHYSFKAPPNRRLDIIRAIEAVGGAIEEFHTDPPEWELLIKREFQKHGGRGLGA